MTLVEKKPPTMLNASRRLLALAILSALASSCASAREGYLYDSQAPRKGSIVFQDASSNSGNLIAQLADGENCTGRFNTIPDEVEVDQETNRIDREDSQVGLAILQCSAQHVLRCGFQRDRSGAGYGHCSDTAGRHFDLYF
ncbi:MAG TPA: hypothetical protein VFK05_13705 [Polyangiaceae bacterium]|nr:hypothetical protein [Polyangiaceae bacterium]